MPSALPAVSPIPSKPLLQVVTNDQIISMEKAQRDAQRAYQFQGNPPIPQLSAHIRMAWQAAKQAKQESETELLKCLRARLGMYDPDKLDKIKKHGGTAIFMQVIPGKCRATESWVKDVLLPAGDKPWSISSTPIPELPPQVEQEIVQKVIAEFAMQIYMGLQNPQQEAVIARMEEIREEIQREREKRAKASSKRFERRIEDELVEGNFYESLSQFITDMVTFPAAILKGPDVVLDRRLTWDEDGRGGVIPKIAPKYIRQYSRVSPFDAYPGPGCKNIQDGYFIERLRLRRGDLFKMIGVPGFDEGAIRAVIGESEHGTRLTDWLAIDQQRHELESRPQEQNDPDPPIEALEFWGPASGQKLRDWGMKDKNVPDPHKDYQIRAWQIDQWTVMARVNPHPLGVRPYYTASYEQLNDSIWGKSPPYLMRDVQNLCNALARALVNNLGISSGPQVEVMVDRIMPGEDIQELYPWKIWKTLSDPNTAGYALQFYQPNPLTDMLLKAYEYFLDQASEQSGIPAYIYGNEQARGGGAGATASGLAMLMNAASKSLRNVIRHVDESVLKKAIYQHWLHIMLYDDDIMKTGDINIIARASEHLIIEEQLQLRRTEYLERTNNPADLAIMGLEGRAAIHRGIAKSLKLPGEEIIPTKEEMAARAQGMQQQGGGGMPGQGALPISPQGQITGPGGEIPGGEMMRLAKG